MSGRYHADLHDEWHPAETAEEEAWFRAQEAADAQHEAEHGNAIDDLQAMGNRVAAEMNHAFRHLLPPGAQFVYEFDPSEPSATERDWHEESAW